MLKPYLLQKFLCDSTSSSLMPRTWMPAASNSSFRSGEGLALDGAAGRVVLGIDVDDQPLAGEVGKAQRLAVLVGKGEVRE
jgi:hypothetical protein